MTSHGATDTDIVSLSALHLAATVGPDQWHRTRSQPIHLSIHLHLAPSYLDTPGRSDDVADSLHYGHLTKAVEKRVRGRTEGDAGRGYASARALVDDVTDAAFEFVRDAVGDGKRDSEVIQAVRVVLALPKQILLAEGFELELGTRASDWIPSRMGKVGPARSKAGAIVRVTNLVLPVIIGVNPPERLVKQRVITNLSFFEAARSHNSNIVEGEASRELDYPAIVQQIVSDIENSSHLTLERLVYEIIRTAYRASDATSHSNSPPIDAITVRCHKPSALSFADASGVEMTRTRWGFNSERLNDG